MSEPLILWSHALAAMLFAALALWALRREAAMPPPMPLTVAFACTALWSLAVAGIGGEAPGTHVAEVLRNLAWLTLLAMLHRQSAGRRPPLALGVVYGVVAVVVVAALVLALSADAAPDPQFAAQLDVAAQLYRMMAGLTALVLIHSLYGTAGQGTRAILIALAVMWISDCAVFAVAYLTGVFPAGLAVARGAAMVLAAACAALAMHRRGDWAVQMSRTVTYQSLSLLAIGGYLAVVAVATSAIAAIGGDHVRLLQTAFVFGLTATVLTLVSTPWLRAWTRVKLAKHLFRHRYDYRAEWLRFTETLGEPRTDTSLDERIVKAIADLVDSPGGVLLVPGDDGLGVGAVWNWDRGELPGSGADAALAARLGDGARIVELDAVRAGTADADAAVPQWMYDLPRAWALVPLPHFGKLAGAILLARPPVDRALDWEDFDLLRIAGRQSASYLAEARAHEALMEAQRFEEFNRRFAFILHDIKNLVSQLTLVARNAERHADNPEFRADMVATLKGSAERMTDLLDRLSRHGTGKSQVLGPLDVATLADRIAAGRRGGHPVARIGEPVAMVEGDSARLEQLLGHLVQNAVEASPADEPVTIAIGRDGAGIAIDVIDKGCGMSPGFVRDRLFKPFVSSKPGGFGIGAFEALQLARAMHGTLDVVSREGEGTRFRLMLPASGAPTIEEKAA